MEDEIKEILDYLKQMSVENEPDIELSREEVKSILDYITNLYGYYNDNVNKYEELIVKYSDLQEENKRLKEELQQEKKDFKETNDYCFELKDYKSRCQNAIELIYKSMQEADITGNGTLSLNNLLNILQGSDKK